MQRLRGGLVFKAHRLVYHSTLGLRVIKKKGHARECAVARALGALELLDREVGGLPLRVQRDRVQLWEREFKLPWREAGPPNHHDDDVDSDQ